MKSEFCFNHGLMEYQRDAMVPLNQDIRNFSFSVNNQFIGESSFSANKLSSCEMQSSKITVSSIGCRK